MVPSGGKWSALPFMLSEKLCRSKPRNGVIRWTLVRTVGSQNCSAYHGEVSSSQNVDSRMALLAESSVSPHMAVTFIDEKLHIENELIAHLFIMNR